jgi:c-di-GMP-binding flagellar brake protein YcgR
MSTPTPPWPELHSRVELFGPWYETWLPSLVEDRDGGLMQLAIPNAPGTIVPIVAQPGDNVTVHWVTGRGAVEVDCRVREIQRSTLASWSVQALGLPVIRQRRAYVRAEVHMPLNLMPQLGEPPLEAWAVDLSEGGMRVVTANEALDIGRRALLEMDIEGETVFVQAEVLRFLTDRDGAVTVALKFVDLHRRDADRIRRFVFASQLRTTAGKH